MPIGPMNALAMFVHMINNLFIDMMNKGVVVSL